MINNNNNNSTAKKKQKEISKEEDEGGKTSKTKIIKNKILHATLMSMYLNRIIIVKSSSLMDILKCNEPTVPFQNKNKIAIFFAFCEMNGVAFSLSYCSDH